MKRIVRHFGALSPGASALWSLAVVSLFSCSDHTVERVRNGFLGSDYRISVGQAIARYECFTRVEWSTGRDKDGRRVVRARGSVSREVFVRQLDEHIETYKAGYPKNYISRRRAADSTHADILRNEETMDVVIEFFPPDDRGAVGVGKIYQMTPRQPRWWFGKTRGNLLDDLDAAQLGHIYGGREIRLKFHHLHKFYYH